MTCKNRQICNICEASFKMTRGCSLEKRCPACRFLGLQKQREENIYKKTWGPTFFLIKDGNFRQEYVLQDDTPLIKEMFKHIKDVLFDDPKLNLDKKIMRNELSNLVEKFINVLNEKEKYVIKERFGLTENLKDDTFQTIGSHFNLTRERIRQIEISALHKLKHPRVARKMKEYINL